MRIFFKNIFQKFNLSILAVLFEDISVIENANTPAGNPTINIIITTHLGVVLLICIFPSVRLTPIDPPVRLSHAKYDKYKNRLDDALL